MQLQESGEMYLETILLLSFSKSAVRAVDIGEHMGYSKPSVSRALSNLRAGGYAETDEKGNITLTDAGREVAEKIYERHTVISGFLMTLGVGEEIAVKDACKIEHHISDESFDAIKKYMKNVK